MRWGHVHGGLSYNSTNGSSVLEEVDAFALPLHKQLTEIELPLVLH